MSFGDEIKRAIGAPEEYRISVYGGSGAYVEGVKRILSFGSEKVCLETKKHILTVEGENLNISEFSGGDVGVRGFVSGVRIQ